MESLALQLSIHHVNTKVCFFSRKYLNFCEFNLRHKRCKSVRKSCAFLIPQHLLLRWADEFLPLILDSLDILVYERKIIECNIDWIKFSSMNLRLVVLWARLFIYIPLCQENRAHEGQWATYSVHSGTTVRPRSSRDWMMSRSILQEESFLALVWGTYLSLLPSVSLCLCPNKCLMNTLTGGHKRGMFSIKTALNFLFVCTFLLYQGYVSWHWTSGPGAS